jgi:hypothetical protein
MEEWEWIQDTPPHSIPILNPIYTSLSNLKVD